jgi:hypothetical protein
MGSGIGIYSIYTLFNDELYDIPSKVSLLVAFAGAGYLYNHINQMRAFDAKQVHIDREFKNFYLGLNKSGYTEKYFNLGSEQNPVEIKILASLNQD